MPSYDECKNLGRQIVGALVDPATATPQLNSVLRIHQELLRLGLRLRDNQDFGLPGGRQLLYTLHPVRPGVMTIIVRVKTHGNADRPPHKRVGVPHMAVSIVDGGLGWDRERAKFNSQGMVASKMTTDGADPPAQGYTFPTLIVPGMSPERQNAWADRVHFDFAPGFDATGATTLVPEPVS